MRSIIRHFNALPTCVLLLLLALVPIVQAQDVIPPSGKWVTDRAGMLSSSERQMLTTTLRGYADSTSTQIIIVTLPDLDGEPISDYAIALGQRWQVGQGDTDNGAVILVSRDDREVFIATGFGLEGAIPDVVASRIIRNIIVPNFREGRVFAGLSGAVDAMIAAAAGEYTADSPPAGNERGNGGGGGIDYTTLYILFIIGYFIFTSFRRRDDDGGKGGGRRRRSGLPFIIFGGGGGSGWGGGSSGGGGFGGFSGGGGGFGGGGAGGSW